MFCSSNQRQTFYLVRVEAVPAGEGGVTAVLPGQLRLETNLETTLFFLRNKRECVICGIPKQSPQLYLCLSTMQYSEKQS